MKRGLELEQTSLATKRLFTNQELFRLFLPIIIEQFLEADGRIKRSSESTSMVCRCRFHCNHDYYLSDETGFYFGTAGVAIPTLIARIAAAVIIITLALNKKQSIYIKNTLKHKFNWSMIKKILGIGVPYGLENGLSYLGRIVVLSLVAIFGTAAIAAIARNLFSDGNVRHLGGDVY